MRLRGAIFDLDGTLVDSLAGIAAAVNHGLAGLGLPVHRIEAVGAMVGEGVKTLCRKALPADRRDDPALNEDYPGLRDLVDALPARGVKLAVLSNKPDALTRRTIDGLGLSSRFVSVRGERAGVPRKPDPTSALDIVRELGVARGDVLYVGDTPIDMETARRAGLAAVAVTWGFRSRDELERCEPDIVVDAPAEILRLFG
jgi:phosphoglycolate phosphatase